MPTAGFCQRKAVTPVLWGIISFCKQRLYIHRTYPTLLFSLPKSVSKQVQSVGPAGFGLGLSSFSSHETVACLNCSLPRKPPCLAPKPEVLTVSKYGLDMGFALWCISKS